MVDEEVPPDNVKRFECFEKHYINVQNYYYYFNNRFSQQGFALKIDASHMIQQVLWG